MHDTTKLTKQTPDAISVKTKYLLPKYQRK